jgi:hypothetical protein
VKKYLLGLVMMLITAIAFALPSPHQIEDALAAHDYDTAKSMTQEVLRERPDSARAHLLDAFILEHVDGNISAANVELQSASNLDKNGDVKNSSLFGRTVAEIDAKSQVVRQAQQSSQVQQQQFQSPVAAAYVPPEKHSGHGFLIFLLVLVVVVAFLAWLFIRGATRKDIVIEKHVYHTDSSGNRLGSGDRAYISSPVAQPAIVHQTYGQPAVSSGPVIINNSGGYGRGYGSDGFVEGMLVEEMIEDNRSERRRRDNDSWSNPAPAAQSNYERSPSPSPSPTPSPVSYDNERASFSSGRDDSWSSPSPSPSPSSDYSSGSVDSWSSPSPSPSSDDNSW